METLGQQHCYNHGDREAVVLCPVCRQFFCRECVTEHDDRMLCSACLGRLTRATGNGMRRWLRHAGWLVQGMVGFALLWAVFYLVGRLLLAIPDAFHEGTIWKSGWWEVR
jgi:hypothetical protein